MKNKKRNVVSLIPNWVLKEDILMGWVVIHRIHTSKLGLKHLKHVKVKNIKNNKTITCRIFGPGTMGRYYEIYGSETVKKSIFLDAYYRERLGVRAEDISKNPIEFKITPIKIFGSLRASLKHPNDGVKAGARLGILSIFLAILSIILGVLSLIFALCL